MLLPLHLPLPFFTGRCRRLARTLALPSSYVKARRTMFPFRVPFSSRPTIKYDFHPCGKLSPRSTLSPQHCPIMHSDPTQFALTAPSLVEALTLLARDPGRHTPIAGGTELMVALAAGRLNQKSLLSINHLPELRFIHATDASITIGANTTFTDIRRNSTIARDLPLLTQSASWTGSIANQNRATLGGNIANASPAADTPPALLVYDATVTLISSTSHPHPPLRRLPPRLQTHRPPSR